MLKNFDYEKTPVVELVNEILLDSSKRGASDIHFDPQEDFLKTRIRIDGELVDYAEIPNTIAKNLITRVKIISGMNITESRLPQDGAIKATLENVNLDLRVSALPTNKGEKIVIRILDYTLSLAGIESLGFNQENYKKVLKMISMPNGIILVTGATGSGKSTTVYSILQRLNKENTNIITVEDPIEMDIKGINQIQTNSEIGLDFATVLRSILRQDPNIIMIGEIRDTETAKIAVRASITGHLVLSTLHTNDSLNTIERLLDMEVEKYLLASSLTGIISQKLARKLCPHCKKLRPVNEYEKGIIKKVTGKEVNEIYSAMGCDECKNGYMGRIAIHEVLLINQEIRDALSSNIKKDKLRHLVYNSDVISLLQDGVNKVLEGLTTLEELLKIIELDDDGSSPATGLKNAIDTNELTKEENIIIQEEVKPKNENVIIQEEVKPKNENVIIQEEVKLEKNNINSNEYTKEDVPSTPVINTVTDNEKITKQNNKLELTAQINEFLNNSIHNSNYIKSDNHTNNINQHEQMKESNASKKHFSNMMNNTKATINDQKTKDDRKTIFSSKRNIFK